jgi:putative hydrolase of the HAD superfamily
MIWLFDLDNTLYPYSSGMYQHINQLMNQYLKKILSISDEKVDEIRRNYIKQYGTTLMGMMINHNTDPENFLVEIHSFDIRQFLKKEPELLDFLKILPGQKYIFTNSPQFYAKKVITTLGINEIFNDIFSIETFHYHGKPNPSAFQKVIEILGTKDSIGFVDDEKENIKVAKQFHFFSFRVDSKKDTINNYYREELFPKLKGFL